MVLIREGVVVFEQKFFYSGKWFSFARGGCIEAKVVLLGQKLLYSGKMVVFGQGCCI